MTARTMNNHLFLAAKGGHNDESHNHNDIGQFIIYAQLHLNLKEAYQGQAGIIKWPTHSELFSELRGLYLYIKRLRYYK